jgi:hypothetical protein
MMHSHANQYLTLSCMAQDYLAIAGSSVPSEHAFSSGALTATKRHNWLTPEVFEALQILKGAYWNGYTCGSGPLLCTAADPSPT